MLQYIQNLFNNIEFMRLNRKAQDLYIRLLLNVTLNSDYSIIIDIIWIKSKLYPYERYNTIKQDLQELHIAKFLVLEKNKIMFENYASAMRHKCDINASATGARCERDGSALRDKNEIKNSLQDNNLDFSDENLAVINNNISSTSTNNNTLDTEDIFNNNNNININNNNISSTNGHDNKCEKKTAAGVAPENKKSTQDRIDEFEQDENIMKIYNAFVKYRNVATDNPDVPTATNHRSQYNAWLSEIDRLMRIDKHSVDEICGLIKYMETQSFWYPNFQSISKLRRRDQDGVTYYDRFISLKNCNKNNNNKKEINNEKHKFPDGLRVI